MSQCGTAGQRPGKPLRWAFAAPVALGLVILWAGCAGYRLGPTNGVPAGSKSIRVGLFQNQTAEPRLSDAVASALRRRLQQDGTFRLATQGGADIQVSGQILSYTRSAVSFQPNDVITARDFDIYLVARIVASELATGRTLLKSEVGGRATVRAGADLPSAERQALPLLAEDLARRATSMLVDGSW